MTPHAWFNHVLYVTAVFLPGLKVEFTTLSDKRLECISALHHGPQAITHATARISAEYYVMYTLLGDQINSR